MSAPAPVLLADSLTEVPATPDAQWLPPAEWPAGAGALFLPGPPAGEDPVIITRYADVEDILMAPAGTWSRDVPDSVVPPAERHAILDASWLLDGPEHRTLRSQLTAVNRGSSPAARQFTRDLTRALLAAMMTQPPPWNLATIIDEVSYRVVIEHTLAAPPLASRTVRLRQLSRDMAPGQHDAGDVMAYFQAERQTELEDILAAVAGQAGELPPGVARHLAELAASGQLTSRRLTGQLAMLIVSAESQAAAASSLTGMLLAAGLFSQAQAMTGNPGAMRRLAAEGGRRGLSFPFLLLTAARATRAGGWDIPGGTPLVISYAAANMDPEVFGPGAAGFDPRADRPPHLAFGKGIHRCQGAVQAAQFMEDVFAGLAGLPASTRLGHGGQLRREVTRVSWAVPELPAIP